MTSSGQENAIPLETTPIEVAQRIVSQPTDVNASYSRICEFKGGVDGE